MKGNGCTNTGLPRIACDCNRQYMHAFSGSRRGASRCFTPWSSQKLVLYIRNGTSEFRAAGLVTKFDTQNRRERRNAAIRCGNSGDRAFPVLDQMAGTKIATGRAIPVIPGEGGVRVRRVFSDALLSGGALVLLLLVLVAVDDRVRYKISQGFRDAGPAADLAEAGTSARDIAVVIVDAARTQAFEHAPLMLFAFAGTVLVLFMIRN